MSTVKAAFGRGIPLVNLDQGTVIPGSFIVQLAHKLTPAHITDGFCQAVVFDHVLDGETLVTNRLILTNDASRELLLVVTASVTDAHMDASHLEAYLCLCSSVG